MAANIVIQSNIYALFVIRFNLLAMKTFVKPKKHLGQHFLTDLNIARDIVDAVFYENAKTVIEVGPGTGVLTQYLKDKSNTLLLSEVDQESIVYLVDNFKFSQDDFCGDFLQMNLTEFANNDVIVLGNFPYNISSQIFFKVLDYKEKVNQCVGMLQKEVAERICSKEGSKVYGILSVLLQTYYTAEYLFTVNEDVFNPPPKVKSGVIRLVRNDVNDIGVDEKKYKQIVKMAFSTRRKTLRNALKPLNLPAELTKKEIFSKRAEQLSVSDFIELTKSIENC